MLNDNFVTSPKKDGELLKKQNFYILWNLSWQILELEGYNFRMFSAMPILIHKKIVKRK
jgi:hypothetical protein